MSVILPGMLAFSLLLYIFVHHHSSVVYLRTSSSQTAGIIVISIELPIKIVKFMAQGWGTGVRVGL